MSSSSKGLSPICFAAVLSCAILLFLLLPYVVQRHARDGRLVAHAKVETQRRLMAVVTCFNRALSQAELVLPQSAGVGTQISIDLPITLDAVYEYKESQFDRSAGANALDTWGNPVRVIAVLSGFVTNQIGGVQPLVRIVARSFGMNGQDEGGLGDDIVFDGEAQVPALVLGNSPTARLDYGVRKDP